jgi:hypothetical protein
MATPKKKAAKKNAKKSSKAKPVLYPVNNWLENWTNPIILVKEKEKQIAQKATYEKKILAKLAKWNNDPENKTKYAIVGKIKWESNGAGSNQYAVSVRLNPDATSPTDPGKGGAVITPPPPPPPPSPHED